MIHEKYIEKHVLKGKQTNKNKKKENQKNRFEDQVSRTDFFTQNTLKFSSRESSFERLKVSNFFHVRIRRLAQHNSQTQDPFEHEIAINMQS